LRTDQKVSFFLSLKKNYIFLISFCDDWRASDHGVYKST
jgi:hypothetical protein